MKNLITRTGQVRAHLIRYGMPLLIVMARHLTNQVRNRVSPIWHRSGFRRGMVAVTTLLVIAVSVGVVGMLSRGEVPGEQTVSEVSDVLGGVATLGKDIADVPKAAAKDAGRSVEMAFEPDEVEAAQGPEPVRITKSESTDTSITIYWTEPNTNGSVIDGWQVEHRLASQPERWVNHHLQNYLGHDVRQFTVTGLEPNTKYDFAVKAVVGTFFRGGYIFFTGTEPTRTVTLSVGSNSINEGEETAVTATLSPVPTIDMSLTVRVTAGTAESGDFTGGTGEKRLDFPTGIDTASFILGANHDDDSDDETVMVALGTLPSGVTAGGTASLTITIVDDDPPPPIVIGFNPTMYTRNEGMHPNADVTVARVAGSSRENAIHFTLNAVETLEDSGASQGGAVNATPNKDFAAGVHKGIIPAGEDRVTVHIPIIDDQIAESPEDFHVVLTADDPSTATVSDDAKLALVAVNDNDMIYLSYRTDYLKVSGPGWNLLTAELLIHVDLGTDKPFEMNCSSKDGKIEPVDFTVPASDGPQTVKVTITPAKDAHFKYDRDIVNCVLEHAPNMIEMDYMLDGVPVWVIDGDAGDLSKGEYYLGGDMVKPGDDAWLTLYVARPEGLNSSETFNLTYYNAHYCDGKPEMTGPDKITVPESRGTNNILFRVNVPSDACDAYAIWAAPTTPDTYTGMVAGTINTGGFGIVHVIGGKTSD